ncbi:hypothetical protein WA026_011022 [Henosepilachna vigintioctopunctata]|uniref:Uncharacterized protein n=1 Tax=Henosepilachna vigintioctopunctata TaxID=420089 RepID=A0AAW1UQT0_9CUCU
MSWLNQDVLRKELFDYTESSNEDFVGNDTFTPAPPKSIAEYKARTSKVKNPGLFDNDFDSDATVFISGRGKYLKHRIITPGEPVELRAEDDIAIQKKIREVSGLGYGNEIIEREFGCKSGIEYNDETDDSIIPDVNLRLVSECPSATSTSRLSTLFQECTITEKHSQNNEYSQTESCNSPKPKKKSKHNSGVIISSTDNSDGAEFLKPEKKKLKDQLDLKNQNFKDSDEHMQKVNNQLFYMVGTESLSTEESSQRESSSSATVYTKSKKKKKFKKFCLDNNSSTIEKAQTTSVPVWSTIRSNAGNICKEDFPSLK